MGEKVYSNKESEEKKNTYLSLCRNVVQQVEDR